MIRCLFLLSLIAASGASCPRAFQPSGPPTPVAFAAPPSFEQVRQYVNAQTAKVVSLQTTGAKLHVAGAPTLSASLALERPQRLRMQASLGFTGTELDLGSNDEEFWFWAKRNEPPGVYVARHDQAHSPGVRSVLPVPPSWLIDALGIVEWKDDCQYQGPFARSPEQFEIRATCPTSSGYLTKVMVVDAKYGYIVEQHVFDARGTLIATARCQQHEYLPSVGVSLPRSVDVQLPTMALQFRLEVDHYLVNQWTADPQQLWRRPEFPGFPVVNLAGL